MEIKINNKIWKNFILRKLYFLQQKFLLVFKFFVRKEEQNNNIWKESKRIFNLSFGWIYWNYEVIMNHINKKDIYYTFFKNNKK